MTEPLKNFARYFLRRALILSNTDLAHYLPEECVDKMGVYPLHSMVSDPTVGITGEKCVVTIPAEEKWASSRQERGAWWTRAARCWAGWPRKLRTS